MEVMLGFIFTTNQSVKSLSEVLKLTTLWEQKNPNMWVFNWQHIYYALCTSFASDSMHYSGYILCTFLSFLFMHSFEDVDCMQGLLKKNENQLAMSFNLTIRCMDDFIHWIIRTSMTILVVYRYLYRISQYILLHTLTCTYTYEGK
jgi:hypothetical protein